MANDEANDHRAERYFAARAEQLIGQVVGTLDASAGHPADPAGGWQARVAALEERLAGVDRRLARIEERAAPLVVPHRPAPGDAP